MLEMDNAVHIALVRVVVVPCFEVLTDYLYVVVAVKTVAPIGDDLVASFRWAVLGSLAADLAPAAISQIPTLLMSIYGRVCRVYERLGEHPAARNWGKLIKLTFRLSMISGMK